ncbi:hypothetical protein OR214_03866 [Ralstonia pickettii OR214]|jgi:hypothetical protein|uniref:Uncharacterized protein n=1 Tax=Ralstonia pickettii OR214 TaxID=1264675 RepID=R0E3F7_RALPI|nr:hypothetical protein OR214_03866 [Ralstonia pickettii OR214]
MLNLRDYLEMPLEIPSGKPADLAALRRVLDEHPFLLVDSEGAAFAVMLPMDVFQRLCHTPARVTVH